MLDQLSRGAGQPFMTFHHLTSVPQAAKGKGGAKQQQLQKQKPPDTALGTPAQQHRDPEMTQQKGDVAEETGAAAQEAAAEQQVWMAKALHLNVVSQSLMTTAPAQCRAKGVSWQPAKLIKTAYLLQDIVDPDNVSTELKQRIAAAQKRKQQQQQEKTGFAEVLSHLGVTMTHVHRLKSPQLSHRHCCLQGILQETKLIEWPTLRAVRF